MDFKHLQLQVFVHNVQLTKLYWGIQTKFFI